MSVLLAKTWAGTDPAGWWLSEKLDGVRAVWDCRQLRTRTGQTIHAPQWFLDSLPKSEPHPRRPGRPARSSRRPALATGHAHE